ncbi:TetR/AcrR family transcriptional regulator [Acrocarpospora catenulata]|uniref:TetR/AcrR family transcriptional regulator n=1 Tax=Acrocarpospora catenulata TaxID=2836182 RepID=UPI001BDB4230|nr:TetR/AcrR family transcriptional regulator [Acrocarpospora catenulata]
MRADARRNYDRLLAEAGEAFARHGIDASLEEIAKAAGVGIGTLYRHFPARQDLIVAVLRDSIDALLAEGERLREEEPGEALRVWLHAQIAHMATTRGLCAELIIGLKDPASPLYGTCHLITASGDALLRQAQDAGVARPDLTIQDLVKSLNGIAWVAERFPDDPGQADRLLSLLLDGVRVRPALHEV